MKRRALRAALPYTLPVCVGYVVLGMSYGFLMRTRGFSLATPIIMSVVVFAGSMQFAAGEVLLAPFDPLYALFLTLAVNARHLFYVVSRLEKYRNTGRKKVYLIYGMSDETFTVNCAVTPPEGVDRGWFMFFVTLLNQAYWVLGTAAGAVLGDVLRFDTTGIEFVMTALFLVMMLNQWEEAEDHGPALIGLGASAVCLAVLGRDGFMIPAMALIAVFCLLGRKRGEGA